MKKTDFSSYVDDNTPYRTAYPIDKVIKLLECDYDAVQIILWQPNERKY